jgi:hypothetical protein
MQAVSNAYKQEMKKQYRDHSYMRVSIGLINQEPRHLLIYLTRRNMLIIAI